MSLLTFTDGLRVYTDLYRPKTSLGAKMSSATQITLNRMKDWDDWIEVIRTAALGADI